MITINFFFKLSFATQSNREGRNKSAIYRILSVELLKRRPKQSSVAPLSASFLSSRPKKTSTKYYRNPLFFQANSRLI